MERGHTAFFASRLIAALIGCGLILAALLPPTAARAGTEHHGSDGDPLSEVPCLFDDCDGYGTIRDNFDSTTPNGKQGDACGYWQDEGASAFKISARAGDHLDLDVTDDLDGESLCDVAVYRNTLGDETLPAVYGYPDVDDYRTHHDEDSCLEYNSVCRFRWRIGSTDTFYLVFWPRNYEDANAASFSFTVRMRRDTRTGLAVSDYLYRDDAVAVEERGNELTATARVRPRSSGSVRFTLKKRSDGRWVTTRTTTRSLEGSVATLSFSISHTGRYRLRAHYTGNDRRYPSTSPSREIRIV
jgi:hypothetical protein